MCGGWGGVALQNAAMEKTAEKIALRILPNGNAERVAADLEFERGAAPAIGQRSSQKQSKKQN